METLTDDKHTKQCLGHLIFSMFQINTFHAFFYSKNTITHPIKYTELCKGYSHSTGAQ